MDRREDRPIRLTIGAESLAQNAVEFKLRSAGRDTAELVPLDAAVERCQQSAVSGQLTFK